MEYQIHIYQTDTGKRPYKIWLNSLSDVRAKSIVRIRLDRMRLGNFGHSKAVGGGVFELKIDFGPGYRVYTGSTSKLDRTKEKHPDLFSVAPLLM